MDIGFGACSVKDLCRSGNFLRDIFALTLDEYIVHDSDSLKVISYDGNWISPTDRDWEKELPVDGNAQLVYGRPPSLSVFPST